MKRTEYIHQPSNVESDHLSCFYWNLNKEKHWGRNKLLADDILKKHFVDENVCIKISHGVVPSDLVDNKPALVEITRRQTKSIVDIQGPDSI